MLFEVVLTDKYPFANKDDMNAIELNGLSTRELEDLFSIIQDTDKFLIISVVSDKTRNANEKQYIDERNDQLFN